MQVKVFYDSSPDELEEKVNNWLKSDMGIEVIQLTTQYGSDFDPNSSSSTIWRGMSFATVLYKMK